MVKTVLETGHAPRSAEEEALLAKRRTPDAYTVSDEDKEYFNKHGYVVLKGVCTEEEVAELETVFMKFVRQEIKCDDKDFCDMSGDFGRKPEDFSIVNAMLPRRYYPEWKDNVYEKRARSISQQLGNGGMALDYDQLLAKRPHKSDAIFPWHQDSAYWPPFKADPATTTCWLAIDDSSVANGCMRFVSGSHKEEKLREHAPFGKSREEAHALFTPVNEDAEGEPVHYVPIRRGDITVHNERVVHGSGPNSSDGWRRAYVIAFRKKECIDEERSMGFSHSHNDETNWDTYHDWGKNTNNPHFASARRRMIGDDGDE